MIIVVHASDCKAIQWSPIAQQSDDCSDAADAAKHDDEG